MLLRTSMIVLFLFFTRMSVLSQQHIGQWKSFTNMRSVRSAVMVGTNIWAATSGGVFVFDTVSGATTKFTNTDGLDTNNIKTIAFDGLQSIWVGGAGGWVNVYDMSLRQWKTIEDIAIKMEYPNRGIQSFHFKGDTIFIVTEFGVSVFSRSRWEFGDTYANLGSLSSPQVTCMALQKNRIWIGTNVGIATALLSAPNSWISYTLPQGFPSQVITALTVVHDTLIIGTNSGLGYFANDVFSPIVSFNGKVIRDLQINKEEHLLVMSVSGSTVKVDKLAFVLDLVQPVLNSEVQGFYMIPASSLWIATIKGLAQQTSSGWKYFYPNGPNSDFFNSVVVDEEGVLWAASGVGPQAGFYRYNPNLPDTDQWKNFTSDLYPIMRQNGALFDNYYKVSLGTPGTVWVSSWNEGLVEVVADTIQRKLNSYSRPSLLGATGGDDVVGGAAAVDDQGKVWITSRSDFGTTSLLRYDGDSSGVYFVNSYKNFHDIIIDHNGTKWIATGVLWNKDGKFLYSFNENTNGWRRFTTDQGLLSNMVFSLALDLDGAVWAGLSLGVFIISDPLYPSSYQTSFPLRQQTVQTIAVDAVNNKWIGTKEGVFVVNPDGTELLRTYTVATTNKQLLANDVHSIALDQKRGIAYFGTDQGLSSLVIEPVQTVKSFSKLVVGPNPFILPSKQPLTIRNLVAKSTIKIMTVSGSLVTQFEAQGGGRSLEWYGRDKNGALVSSGIYFIVAFTENGSQTVIGKVAVIRH